ncbi:MAG: flagellar basal-body rod protein FlgF [Deltaproteobacteria bacterium]|nr:flagellar basal-body rod protein FlgF [Deltaproteobacteria bacterium]
MVSGKYSALAGAISREQTIANISANLANINTTGYKSSLLSFESVLQGAQQSDNTRGIDFSRIKNSFTDFTPGAMRPTERPLDMAISGDGFFKLMGSDGLLYTRRGDFTMDAGGLLTTSNGLSVLDAQGAQIYIPDIDGGKVAVGDNGMIYILDRLDNREEVAQLAVVNITDKLKLKREKDTTFSLGNDTAAVSSDNYRVIQGHLELSNVNMTSEMAKMIDSHRIFETYHKVLKSFATISEQQDELGTVA